MDSVNAILPAASHRAETTDAYQTAVERVIAHMKVHLEEPLELDRIAEIAAISKYHLVRVFDEVTGTTPHHFLACLRMQRAKELLLASGTSITEVCLSVGYSSLGTFSTTFSTLVGLSPQEFREMPRRITVRRFATAIWRYLAGRRRITGPILEGTVQGPARPRGFIFVGTFTRGVPLGVPVSGTVMVTRGRFRIERPPVSEFHLLAAQIRVSAASADMVADIPVSRVASLRIRGEDLDHGLKPALQLRPFRPTDPPIVLALAALPPLRLPLSR
jgi:AraC family transcriptional regulator